MRTRRPPPRDGLARWARRHAEHPPTADAIAQLEHACETIARAQRSDTEVIETALEKAALITVAWDEDRDEEVLMIGDDTQIFLGSENPKVLEVLWVLLDAADSPSTDPWVYALNALVEAKALTRS